MSIRTILVHLDSAKQTQARVAAAAELALRHEAHLIGLAPTGRVVVPMESVAVLGLDAYEESALRLLRERAQVCVDDFERLVQRLGVPTHESRVAVGHASDVVANAAKYADLTVVSQLDPEETRAEQAPQMPHDVLLQSGRPLLVLPCSGEWTVAPARRVLVGWNASREAARAMHDALPFMKAAANVEVAVFETKDDVFIDHGQVPGADIGLWLARHGVKVEVKHVPAKVAAGKALLSHAVDIGADLIVAGGYGHSRFRQSILGGVTRTLLLDSPLPVLLSH
jgi:nucleotide-binding universal stress UspA family protein